MPTKRILCFANSKKMSGRCIAGREVSAQGPGPWVRPISNRPTEEVTEYERQYQDGSDPRVLDLIDVPVICHHPHACQSENWLIDANEYWVRSGQARWHHLQEFTENPATLWHNGHSTYHGLNDEIPRDMADALPNSLHLIHVGDLELHVFAPGAAFGNPKRRVQGAFQHRGVNYKLWVTDPLIEREYLRQDSGTYTLGESMLCLSLGEPYQKNEVAWCRYKLVAGIIQKALVV